ncbi:HAD family hydrolase [Aliihoeflea sp. PC F10.4]
MAIKAILFDKDGTLVDFNATWFAVADRLAMEAAGGDRAGANALLERTGYDFASGRFRADSVFAAGTNAEIVDMWYPDADVSERRERIGHFDVVTASEGTARAVPLPGVLDALATLHRQGMRLAVATNDSTQGAERTLVTLGVSQLFEAAYGYDAVANPKPAPDVIIAFSDMTGLKPSEIAMVGDNNHDMETGRAAGAGLRVAVLSGTGTRATLEPLAHVVLDSIADLPAYFNGRG